MKINRVLWVVLDGVGAGELPDAAQFGDQSSNTLRNLGHAFKEKTGRYLSLPNMGSLGLGNITNIPGVAQLQTGQGRGAFGKAAELSPGKDTTSGHWEMAGLMVEKPFHTFPNGFPLEVVQRWQTACHLPGVLGNRTASGTEIIEELGEEHLKTLKPILYTSADSVWQIAAHEEYFGLQKLYEISKTARKICDELGVARVIARPFVGNPKQGIPFKRTYNRKDLSTPPPGKTMLSALQDSKISTVGIGKISSIFDGLGIDKNTDTAGNAHGIEVILKSLNQNSQGLIFCNLIDTDMLYGHRRDIAGFGHCLEAFDQALTAITNALKKDDLLIITADHGNDPTFKGTDHTREYVPILALHAAAHSPAIDLGTRSTFADIGETIFEALTHKTFHSHTIPSATSFLKTLENHT